MAANALESAVPPEEITPAAPASPAAPSPVLDQPGTAVVSLEADRNWLALLGRFALPSIALVAGGGLSAYARNRFQTAHLFAPDRYPLGFWNPQAHGLPAEDDW